MHVKVASQSASHNWAIDSNDRDLSSGTMCTCLARRGSCGKSSLASCVECLMEPFRFQMAIGCVAGCRLLMGVCHSEEVASGSSVSASFDKMC